MKIILRLWSTTHLQTGKHRRGIEASEGPISNSHVHNTVAIIEKDATINE